MNAIKISKWNERKGICYSTTYPGKFYILEKEIITEKLLGELAEDLIDARCPDDWTRGEFVDRKKVTVPDMIVSNDAKVGFFIITVMSVGIGGLWSSNHWSEYVYKCEIKKNWEGKLLLIGEIYKTASGTTERDRYELFGYSGIHYRFNFRKVRGKILLVQKKRYGSPGGAIKNRSYLIFPEKGGD